MTTDILTRDHTTSLEQLRLRSVFGMIPRGGGSALDVGARDGCVSTRLLDYFSEVTAVDLEKPSFESDRIVKLRGDVTRLEFPDNHFDTVVCTEVLEHVPSNLLPKACSELARVAGYEALIGVPYRQDTRLGRTTCLTCGMTNPPYGHLNSFDEAKLQRLFRPLTAIRIEHAGSTKSKTNFLSALLMDLAGNPWGSYEQAEPCLHCGAPLRAPDRQSLADKVFGKAAHLLTAAQNAILSPQPIWIHVLFQKRER